MNVVPEPIELGIRASSSSSSSIPSWDDLVGVDWVGDDVGANRGLVRPRDDHDRQQHSIESRPTKKTAIALDKVDEMLSQPVPIIDADPLHTRLSIVMKEVWLRVCKDAIGLSLSKDIDLYQRTLDEILSISRSSLARFLRPIEYQMMRARLRSMGVRAPEHPLPPPVVPVMKVQDDLGALAILGAREPGGGSEMSSWPMITVFRPEWRPDGSQALHMNEEALSLFGFTTSELIHIWELNTHDRVSQIPLWPILIAEEDWAAVAEHGCRSLLSMTCSSSRSPRTAIHIVTKQGTKIKCLTHTQATYSDSDPDDVSCRGPITFTYGFVPDPEALRTNRPVRKRSIT